MEHKSVKQITAFIEIKQFSRALESSSSWQGTVSTFKYYPFLLPLLFLFFLLNKEKKKRLGVCKLLDYKFYRMYFVYFIAGLIAFSKHPLLLMNVGSGTRFRDLDNLGRSRWFVQIQRFLDGTRLQVKANMFKSVWGVLTSFNGIHV